MLDMNYKVTYTDIVDKPVMPDGPYFHRPALFYNSKKLPIGQQ